MIAETVIDQMAKSIRYVKPVPMGSGGELVNQLYAQMQEDFLPVPLLTLHAPAPTLMAGAWSILRESLLAGREGSARARTRKEVVAAAVSKSNECPFCVDAHSLMLHASAAHDVAGAVLRGDFDAIRDAELQALAQWAFANRTAHAPITVGPFDHADAPEIIGTATAFHYINRMVNVFLGDSLLPLPSVFKGVTGRWLAPSAGKRFVQQHLAQGKSLRFMPTAALPTDLAWAAGDPAIASAFAGFASLVEQAGSMALSAAVRDLVSARVQAWQGEEIGLSRRWVEELVAQVAAEDRVAARLALLTALASYQVDASVVEAYQAQEPRDAHLLAVTAWASFTAARRASQWIAAPLMNRETRVLEEIR